jgi:hypothetical protein
MSDTLDQLVSEFLQYGDRPFIGPDACDRLRNVIVQLTSGAVKPPFDRMGENHTYWMAAALQWMRDNGASSNALGPELFPPEAVWAPTFGDANTGSYSFVLPIGNEYLVTFVTGGNVSSIHLSETSISVLGLTRAAFVLSDDSLGWYAGANTTSPADYTGYADYTSAQAAISGVPAAQFPEVFWGNLDNYYNGDGELPYIDIMKRPDLTFSAFANNSLSQPLADLTQTTWDAAKNSVIAWAGLTGQNGAPWTGNTFNVVGFQGPIPPPLLCRLRF